VVVVLVAGANHNSSPHWTIVGKGDVRIDDHHNDARHYRICHFKYIQILQARFTEQLASGWLRWNTHLNNSPIASVHDKGS
jgi:hypothetical protein